MPALSPPSHPAIARARLDRAGLLASVEQLLFGHCTSIEEVVGRPHDAFVTAAVYELWASLRATGWGYLEIAEVTGFGSRQVRRGIAIYEARWGSALPLRADRSAA